MERQPKLGFKFKVTQTYDVYIYYENGVVSDTDDDAADSVIEDVLDLAFNEDGLVVFTDEEANNSNGFVALINTHDPDVDMIYHIEDVPKEIKKEIQKRKIEAND